jgi:hypothetical protein
MILNKSRGISPKATGLTAAFGVLGLTVACQASAACMDSGLHQESPQASSTGRYLTPAVYRQDGLRRVSLLTVEDIDEDRHSIVGLFEFKFTGFTTDWGTQAWHSDGTELLFSGGQNPETGDVCQGVWRKVGPSTYTLNHIAMGWTAPGGVFGIRIHLHAIVKLSPSGDSYSGTYKAAAYQVSPTDPFDENAQVGSGTGTLTGTRVLPD